MALKSLYSKRGTLVAVMLFAAAIVAPQIVFAGGGLNGFTDDLEGVQKLDRSSMADTRGTLSLDFGDIDLSTGASESVSISCESDTSCSTSATVVCTTSGCTSSTSVSSQ